MFRHINKFMTLQYILLYIREGKMRPIPVLFILLFVLNIQASLSPYTPETDDRGLKITTDEYRYSEHSGKESMILRALPANGPAFTTLLTVCLAVIFIFLTLVANLVVEISLIKGRQTREWLMCGLLRYNIFMITVLISRLVAVIVPFILLS